MEGNPYKATKKKKLSKIRHLPTNQIHLWNKKRRMNKHRYKVLNDRLKGCLVTIDYIACQKENLLRWAHSQMSYHLWNNNNNTNLQIVGFSFHNWTCTSRINLKRTKLQGRKEDNMKMIHKLGSRRHLRKIVVRNVYHRLNSLITHQELL